MFSVLHLRYRSPLVCDIHVREFDEDDNEKVNYVIEHVPIGDIPIMLKYVDHCCLDTSFGTCGEGQEPKESSCMRGILETGPHPC